MKIQIKTAAAWGAAISIGMAVMVSQASETRAAKPKVHPESTAPAQGATDASKDAKNFCGAVGKEYVCIP